MAYTTQTNTPYLQGVKKELSQTLNRSFKHLTAMALCGALLPSTVLGLANPNASANTQQIFNYIADLPNQGNSDRVLTGAFGGYSGISGVDAFSLAESDAIALWTQNKRPAIYACDYARGWDTDSNVANLIDYGCNSTLKDLANNQGGFVQISNHLPSPVPSNGGGLKTQITNAQYAQILQDGTAIRTRWLQIMDKVAEGLQDLETAGVVVIYRPLHEMNGEWFWWGNTGTYNADDPTRRQHYKDLWIDMFDYLTHTKGLDNLIWVYSADALRNQKMGFYPGDAYVDIVGLDVYTSSPTDQNIKDGYSELLATNKPFAFAEIGPAQAALGNYDYKAFIDAIKSDYPETTYFIPWNNVWSPSQNQNAWYAYNDDWSINLDDIDLTGVPTTDSTPNNTPTSDQCRWHDNTLWPVCTTDTGGWSENAPGESCLSASFCPEIVSSSPTTECNWYGTPWPICNVDTGGWSENAPGVSCVSQSICPN